ncbi:MAG: hypothetical protein A2Z29_02655 [Chloroflexi bacterium RBG_16_56_11]|nr:MAG: hypothetical protein A2Z29_02655 [Chloroflexi bacterium RBG_16_56_11]
MGASSVLYRHYIAKGGGIKEGIPKKGFVNSGQAALTQEPFGWELPGRTSGMPRAHSGQAPGG